MGLDLIWLGLIAKNFYRQQLGELMSAQPIWPAVVAFYLLFLVGLNYFAIGPALAANSSKLALQNGALYGLFTYMTYQLTNYAVIAKWPVALVVPDILWGSLLAALVSYLTFVIVS